MGKPGGREPVTRAEARGRTWGTETSKYPEEKKITMIAQVAASERALAQTAGVAMRRAGL